MMRKIFLVLALVFPLSSFAQSSAKYEYFEMPGGTRVLSRIGDLPASSLAAQGQAIWDKAVLADGGMPKVQGTGQVRLPSGSNVPVIATARIPAAEVGKAVGRAIGKIVGPIVIASALYDLYKELNFDRASDGTITKADPSACSVAPCYEYASGFSDMGSRVYANGAFVYYPSFQAACQNLIGLTSSIWSYHVVTGVLSASAGSCLLSLSGWSNQSVGVSSRSVAPSTVGLPSTDQEFLDAVAAKSGWPSSSAIKSVLNDDINALPKPPVAIDPITVSGPASSVGPQTVTNDTVNNTTTNSTTTYNHVYAGDTITTTTNITNVTVDNSTGAVTNSTTSSQAGTPTPSDQCKDLPDSVGCTKLGSVPTAEVLSKSTVSVTLTPAVFSSSASCPGDIPLLIDIGPFHSTISFSFVSLCNTASGTVAPIVLLLGAAAAAFIFVGGLKS